MNFLLPAILLIASQLALAQQQPSIPEQMPEIGTNQQIWDAIDRIWKIRREKRWGDPLNASDVASVRLGLDANDYTFFKNNLWFAPQVLEQVKSAVNPSAPVQIRATSDIDRLAYFDPDDNTVYISLTLNSSIYWTNWAFEEATRNNTTPTELGQYLIALSKNGYQRRKMSASSVIRLSEYSTGLPWKASNLQVQEMESAVTGLVFDGFVFGIAHETCHSILGHKANSNAAFSITQEWDADKCAINSIGKSTPAHLNPYPAMTVLALLNADAANIPTQLRRHPNPICRIANLPLNMHHGPRATLGLQRALFVISAIKGKPISVPTNSTMEPLIVELQNGCKAEFPQDSQGR